VPTFNHDLRFAQKFSPSSSSSRSPPRSRRSGGSHRPSPWPCETRTSTCLSFATISSGFYRFLGIWSSLMPNDILQVGPLQRGRISNTTPYQHLALLRHQEMSALRSRWGNIGHGVAMRNRAFISLRIPGFMRNAATERFEGTLIQSPSKG
jgi:hypothetical protein